MSTTIDERVVKMQFDNSNFESNVKTSMSTLDKLKQALKLDDASKGLAELNASAGKVDMGGLSSAVESVSAKFSALQVVGVTALVNITNSAVEAGKQLVKSLSTDQINAGWDKYADKTSAVQTIMAATAKDFKDTGKQMEYVNDQLDKLNWFTDETSYNFVDMVSNIGKFTSNGIKLDKAVTAMQGISTWAGISGANVQEASRAMYNLAQALATGSVKLIDWKSIENANMATAEFKEMVIESALALGELERAADGTLTTLSGEEVSVTNFNQALSEGWFTSDVLMSVLDRYGSFTDRLYDASQVTNLTATELLESIEKYKDGSLDLNEMSQETGISVEELTPLIKSLGDETMELGQKSFRAAQEAKTFQEAIDSVKDAVSTGWMNTFEIIFGNYQEAKKLWTRVANELWDVFAGGGEARNDLLREWSELGGRTELLKGVENLWNGLLDVIENVKEAFHDIFPPITAERLVDLTKKFVAFTEKFKMGDKTAKDFKNTLRGLFAVVDIIGQVFSALWDGIKELFSFLPGLNRGILGVTGSFGEWLVALDESLKKNETFKKGVSTVVEFIQTAAKKIKEAFDIIIWLFKDDSWVIQWNEPGIKFDETRDKLLGLKDAVQSVIKFFKDAANTIKEAFEVVLWLFKEDAPVTQWNEIVMGPAKMVDETKEKFLGLKAVVQSVLNFFTSIPSKIKAVINEIRWLFIDDTWVTFSPIDLLERDLEHPLAKLKPAALAIKKFLEDTRDKIGEIIGDIIWLFKEDISFTQWNEVVMGPIDESRQKLEGLKSVVQSVLGFFKDIPGNVKAAFENFNGSFESLTGFTTSEVWVKIKTVITPIFDNLRIAVDGCKAAFGGIYEKIKALDIVDKIKEKIQSFTQMFMGIGEAADETTKDIKKIGKDTEDTVDGMYHKVEESTGGFNWNGVLAGVGAALSAALTGGFLKWIHDIAEPLKSFKDIINSVSECIDAATDCLEAMQLRLKADALKTIAEAILILAAAFIALSFVDVEKILPALGALSGIIGDLTVTILGISGTLDAFETKEFKQVSNAVLILSGAVLLMSGVVEKLAKLQWYEALQGVFALGAIFSEIAGFVGLMKVIDPNGFADVAASILILSPALIILSGAVEKLGKLKWYEAVQGVLALGFVLGELALATKAFDEKTTSIFLGLGLMVIGLSGIINVIKQFNGIPLPNLAGGMLAMATALGILAVATRLFDSDAIAGAAGLLVMAIALNVLVPVIQALGGMKLEELAIGIGALAVALTVFIVAGYAVEPVVPALLGLGAAILLIGIAMAGIGVAMLSFAEGLVLMGAAGAGAIAVLQLAILTITAMLPSIIENIGQGIVALIKVFGDSAPVFKDTFVAIFTAIIQGFTETIPAMVEAVVKMFDDLLKTILEYMPSIQESGWNIILTFLHGIEDHIGETVETFIGIILAIIDGIANKLPDIIQSGINFILSFIEGLSKGIVDNAERARDAMRGLIESLIEAMLIVLGIAKDKDEATEMVKTAEDAISSFITGLWNKAKELLSAIGEIFESLIAEVLVALGIAKDKDEATKMVEAAEDAIASFVTGLWNGAQELWNSAAEIITEAWEVITAMVGQWIQAGEDLINGLWEGIQNVAQDIIDGIVGVANDLWNGFCNFLGISSPSKKFIEAGRYIDEGLAIGLRQYSGEVVEQSEEVGQNAVDGLSNAISKISDIVESDIDASPTIRPVLDLDNVISGINTMDDMLKSERAVDLASRNSFDINSAISDKNNNTNNDINSLKDVIKSAVSNNNVTNTFNITGDSPKEIADEIAHIMQLQLERRDASWA